MKNTEVHTTKYSAAAVHRFQECKAFPKTVLKREDPGKELYIRQIFKVHKEENKGLQEAGCR